ncbi:MAG: hypothetical protein L3J96_03345, partial [Thermoplasmata archaeon]|nr:hypothetical protein [Thermoplasmata archaeon]
RALYAGLLLIPSLLFYVIIPYVGLTELAQFGITTGYSLGLIIVLGLALAGLGAAAYFSKPTKAYGPLSIAGSALAIVYLLLLAKSSSITLGVGNSGSFTLFYGGMLTLFAIVPAIRIGSGVLTTLEDVLRPGERLPFDFPAGP